MTNGPGALRITGAAPRDRCQTPTDEPGRDEATQRRLAAA